jgi:hypothetical protein
MEKGFFPQMAIPFGALRDRFQYAVRHGVHRQHKKNDREGVKRIGPLAVSPRDPLGQSLFIQRSASCRDVGRPSPNTNGGRAQPRCGKNGTLRRRNYFRWINLKS